MGLDSIASLVIATYDLAVVKSVRDAIRTADLSSGKLAPVSKLGPAPNDPRHDCCCDERGALDRFEPTARIEPRRVYHPEPRYEARRVIRPEPRVEPKCDAPVACDCPPPTPSCDRSPIQPPWRVLPWDQPLALPEKKVVKLIVRPPDIARRGRMIDLFV